jgi:hypothetical protein
MHKIKSTIVITAASMFIGFLSAAPEPTPKELNGEITGKIAAKDGGKIRVVNQEQELTLMPFWRGGNPQDGGSFDRKTLEILEQYKVGDIVTVVWTFEEHYRIVNIRKTSSVGDVKDQPEKEKQGNS